MLPFDIQFPKPFNLDELMDEFAGIANHNISCSEDSERCSALEGAIRMLRLQQKQGMITDEHVRSCLKTMWSEWFGYGTEDETEDD